MQNTVPVTKTNKRLWWFIGGGILAVACLVAGYLFFSSPSAIRTPSFEHAHLRMQVLVEGQPVNLGNDAFQTDAGNAACSQDITQSPIHLHDHKDQFVHLHWKHMTGGLILKNYGWERAGGIPGVLGYRFDQLPKVTVVPAHGTALPAYPTDKPLWVFVGDDHAFTERSAADFLHQDIETFFNKQSSVAPAQAWFDSLIFAKALAHDTQDHSDAQKLEQINNLLGNVVIFAQTNRPTDQEVAERFAQLAPLSASTCGG